VRKEVAVKKNEERISRKECGLDPISSLTLQIWENPMFMIRRILLRECIMGMSSVL
jgi:hypothetical protein